MQVNNGVWKVNLAFSVRKAIVCTMKAVKRKANFEESKQRREILQSLKKGGDWEVGRKPQAVSLVINRTKSFSNAVS
ncbi:hypothetical protein RJ641_014930 [Dillenia turbinata]|uniref:Uncharacterized protein n=1 Tax=Dillenia turbinata TaxID=194707 RepID=A0AAN8V5A9_9MAGN